jgi:hypothetical protein
LRGLQPLGGAWVSLEQMRERIGIEQAHYSAAPVSTSGRPRAL